MKNDDIIRIIESTAISVASSFPILASLATGWSEYKNHLQVKNIENILENFYQKLTALGEKLDKEYLDSDELKALIIKTCMGGKEEISSAKRKMLSSFLANSCTSKLSDDISKNSILETIIRLSPSDVYLMKLISEKSDNFQNSILDGSKKYDPNNGSWLVCSDRQIIDLVNGIKEHEVLASLDYLNSVGVIESPSSRNMLINFESHFEDIMVEKEFRDLQDKRDEIYKNRDSDILYFQKIEKLDEEIQRFDQKHKNRIRKHNGEKQYMISPLGLAVLKYLK